MERIRRLKDLGEVGDLINSNNISVGLNSSSKRAFGFPSPQPNL